MEDWIRKNLSTSDKAFYQGALHGDAVTAGILYSVASKNSSGHQSSLSQVSGENNFKWGNPKSTPTYGHTFLARIILKPDGGIRTAFPYRYGN